MDKNTIYGLVLMALVFFGFMWLSPKPEKGADSAVNTESPEAAAGAAQLGADSLSSQELDWLKSNIATHGTPATTAAGAPTKGIKNSNVDLVLSGDSITGYVTVNGKTMTWADVRSGKVADIQAQRAAINAVRELSESMGKYGAFAKFRTGADQKVTLQNDVLDIQLSSKSGAPTRAMLKKYDTEYNADETKNTRKKVVIFEDGSDAFSFSLPLPQSIETSDLYFRPEVLNDSTVRMTLDVADGAFWGIEYTLPKGNSYLLGVKIVQQGMQRVVQSNNRILGFNWSQRLRRQEKGRMFEERQSGLFYQFAGGSVENLSEAKDAKEERQSKIQWIGFKNQFFSSVMIADRPFTNADLYSEVLKKSDYLKKLDAHATQNDYDWSAANPASFTLFIGPNSYPLLDHIDDTLVPDTDLQLTKLIPLGWSLFRWINTLVIIPVFDILGKYIHNYGIIILILTIFIKLILFPLTYKSYKSQAKMRVLQPDIKAINDKYPGTENAMIRQQKTMELYGKAGASPMSGCLPMLLQMPILFAMFSFFPSCIELRGQSFLWAHDLSAPDAIISWTGNIPLVTEYFGNHISLFCLLMTATNIIYTHINMQNTPQTMPGMKWMMYLMPVFFLVFFNNYAAGLSYYYFLSLLITIIQTYAIRAYIKEDDVRKAMAENAKKPKKKSGFYARLEEMQRQQQAMLKEQQRRQQNKR